ncbi:hypothetical protein HMPREF1990_01600 [Porphyromonas gingivalis W4087]|uniref:Uncharacterized protein n=1 Tax=Porphyromonas gingivalis F0570 TaxID=1227271 RepID=A0A0E2LTC6_PORGN|nr:hypothetical protein HMPREF1555_00106 [Porphyromonas gingivalis F0570]ERJ69316.1 hypothetical protein HMPREF1553_00653 [Porphyromonas gingivalis F0568]ERJ81609.1 hypothetical protein HMPREF1988_01903 [Porphyromonas gingivalis F0185]ERJ87908.1 hypothetical protein HMPREF1990_01600 [Porphyromonas gingivalis W4087]
MVKRNLHWSALLVLNINARYLFLNPPQKESLLSVENLYNVFYLG